MSVYYNKQSLKEQHKKQAEKEKLRKLPEQIVFRCSLYYNMQRTILQEKGGKDDYRDKNTTGNI